MNSCVQQRLAALLNMFRITDQCGDPLSSSSKGSEREFFVKNVLENVIAPPFRIGNGDITDSYGNRSGQCDVVIEYANSISFPILAGSPRLYLAEGVCAVIEVKSDVSSQWTQVKESHIALEPIERNLETNISIGDIPKKIPHFAVGYRGWKQIEKLKEKSEEQNLDGILVLDSGLYYGKKYNGTGVGSLFAFLMTLEELTRNMISATPDYASYINSPLKKF